MLSEISQNGSVLHLFGSLRVDPFPLRVSLCDRCQAQWDTQLGVKFQYVQPQSLALVGLHEVSACYRL